MQSIDFVLRIFRIASVFPSVKVSTSGSTHVSAAIYFCDCSFKWNTLGKCHTKEWSLAFQNSIAFRSSIFLSVFPRWKCKATQHSAHAHFLPTHRLIIPICASFNSSQFAKIILCKNQVSVLTIDNHNVSRVEFISIVACWIVDSYLECFGLLTTKEESTAHGIDHFVVTVIKLYLDESKINYRYLKMTVLKCRRPLHFVKLTAALRWNRDEQTKDCVLQSAVTSVTIVQKLAKFW